MRRYEINKVKEWWRMMRGCVNKKPFDTPDDAYQKGMNIYKCKYCGKYHRSSILKPE